MFESPPAPGPVVCCTECGAPVTDRPTRIDYQGEEIFVFDPVLCPACLQTLCERYAVECANCGGPIPPFSHVGVLKGDRGERLFVHMTTRCTTVGSAFHGYLGKGRLGSFIQVEAC